MRSMPLVDLGGHLENERTIAIVGGGFNGTVLALRLLAATSLANACVVLIERSGRFGASLAYGGVGNAALLNAPAGQVSVNEQQPQDFVQFLLAHGYAADRADFVPRRLYGQYLETRLDEAATSSASGGRLLRVIGTAVSLTRSDVARSWQVEIDDGRAINADQVVLATGHSRPRDIEALRGLANTRYYVAEPFSLLPSTRLDTRVMVVGAGPTMADAVFELAARPNGPREIVAVSRRGLVSRRHLLAPPVERRLHELIAAGRLKPLAGSILSARIGGGRAVVDLHLRSAARVESLEVDQVVNCSGPEGDPRHSRSSLIRSLMADGILTPHAGGLGILVDRSGRLQDRAGDVVPGLYYLGPWSHARDWEATAVRRLRRTAADLTQMLLQNFAQDRAQLHRRPSHWRSI